MKVLEKAYQLMQHDIKPGTAKENELDLLALIIGLFERKHFLILPPSPVDAIKFRMEQLGKSPSELGSILGARSRQSEILNGNVS